MSASSCSTGCESRAQGKNFEHPCYSEKAHHYFARMHLAVAPGCNIQCNYCNRKYDCANESRPGVVVDRLTPEEALKKVYAVAQRMPELSVIGIAGPGDALASPQRTFQSLQLIRQHFPDLTLCLSTNGLDLPKYAEDIVKAGVEHVTVTINCFKPETAQKIYAWVKYQGKKRNDLEAMTSFLVRQRQGLATLVNLGVMVKVNSILMPGINEEELPLLAEKLKKMGVFLHNIMPLISQPEHGTVFGLEGRPEPTKEDLQEMRAKCGDLKQMEHCQQCRADAVGKLGEDKFGEFSKADFLAQPLPETNFAKQREVWKARVAHQLGQALEPEEAGVLVACASASGGVINQHFGHAREFYIYRVHKGVAHFVESKALPAPYCTGDDTCGDKERLLDLILQELAGVQALVCLRLGLPILKRLEEEGILPITDQPMIPVKIAALHAAKQVREKIRQLQEVQ